MTSKATKTNAKRRNDVSIDIDQTQRAKRRKINKDRMTFNRLNYSSERKDIEREKAKKRMQECRSRQSQNVSDLRQSVWRKINQYFEDFSNEEEQFLSQLCKDYQEDVSNFQRKIFPRMLYKVCAVCGLLCDGSFKELSSDDSFLAPLMDTSLHSTSSSWLGYRTGRHNGKVTVCSVCCKALKTKSIPKFSRTNIPLPNSTPILDSLTELEQLLISPILPMIYVWRRKGFGQYQFKGRCVAFYNDVQKIVTALPRHPSEEIVNINGLYGNQKLQVRAAKLRKALEFLKHTHPGFKNIIIRNDVLEEIEKSEHFCEDVCDNLNETSENKFASNLLKDQGQRQPIEDEVARKSISTTLLLHTGNSAKALKEAVINVFKSLSNKEVTYVNPGESRQSWELMFPCLLWNGRGGPFRIFRTINLSEWASYVLQIGSLSFHTHVIFICFTYVTLKRRKISSISTFKPMNKSVRDALKSIVDLSKHNKDINSVPEATLTALSNRLSLHLTNIPGSIQDMRMFRNDLLTMLSRLGPPAIFFTISAADSIWIDCLYEIFNGQVPINKTKCLSVKERADICAKHPVKLTMAWKRRRDALLNLLLKGKSRPFGDISHYALKAEWQGRLSEHAHFLLWLKEPLPNLDINEEGELVGPQTQLLEIAESLSSAMLPNYEPGNSEEVNHPEANYDSITLKEIINREPVSIDVKTNHTEFKFNESMSAIVRGCQIHTHSAYCSHRKDGICSDMPPSWHRADDTIHVSVMTC